MAPISPKSSLHYFAPHLAQQTEGTIHVRAILKGFYANTLRVVGEEFTIATMEEFGDWMELVPDAPDESEAGERAPAAASKGRKRGKSDAPERSAKPEDDVL